MARHNVTDPVLIALGYPLLQQTEARREWIARGQLEFSRVITCGHRYMFVSWALLRKVISFYPVKM